MEDEELKNNLKLSLIEFLRNELSKGDLQGERREALELAIQCLEFVFKADEITSNLPSKPDLLEVYETYLVPALLKMPDATEDQKREAEALKSQGNAAMADGKFSEAVEFYSRAIECAPKNAVYRCNRAAVYSKMENHRAAIFDCHIAVGIDPNYSKAYGRLGLAYYSLENYNKAVEYYKKAIELDPANEAFKNNYEIALRSINNSRIEAATSPLNPENETHFMRNMNTLLNSPHLLDIASQMFANPAWQSIMRNVMSDRLNATPTQPDTATGGVDVENLQEVSQRLATEMFPDIDTLNTMFTDFEPQAAGVEAATSTTNVAERATNAERSISSSSEDANSQHAPEVHDDISDT